MSNQRHAGSVAQAAASLAKKYGWVAIGAVIGYLTGTIGSGHAQMVPPTQIPLTSPTFQFPLNIGSNFQDRPSNCPVLSGLLYTGHNDILVFIPNPEGLTYAINTDPRRVEKIIHLGSDTCRYEIKLARQVLDGTSWVDSPHRN